MTPIDRRSALRWSALALAAAATGLPRIAAAQALGVRLSVPSPGSAGGVWKPLIERNPLSKTLAIEWIGGDPGGVETQLLAHALDASAFGALGASEAQLRGSNVALFTPGLLNHGRWAGNASRRCPRRATRIVKHAWPRRSPNSIWRTTSR
jgi:NitT/TauT family transport system substrate-binding protein